MTRRDEYLSGALSRDRWDRAERRIEEEFPHLKGKLRRIPYPVATMAEGVLTMLNFTPGGMKNLAMTAIQREIEFSLRIYTLIDLCACLTQRHSLDELQYCHNDYVLSRKEDHD